jgi:hypothetical protein
MTWLAHGLEKKESSNEVASNRGVAGQTHVERCIESLYLGYEREGVEHLH